MQIDKSWTPTYFGDEVEFPNPRTLDLTELADLKTKVKETFEKYKKDAKTWSDKQEEKRINDLIESEVKKRMQGIEKETPTASSTNPS